MIKRIASCSSTYIVSRTNRRAIIFPIYAGCTPFFQIGICIFYTITDKEQIIMFLFYFCFYIMVNIYSTLMFICWCPVSNKFRSIILTYAWDVCIDYIIISTRNFKTRQQQ